MLGNITDDKANELIKIVSENVKKNILGRSVVESKLFPVSHYIHTATYILYDQLYQYNITKELVKAIRPEHIGLRSKSLGAPLNQLAMNSFAMLYLHGRAQVINDRLNKKKHGEKNITIESEDEIKRTKYVLDFWRRLIPNYRNDKNLTADNGKIQILADDKVQELGNQMIQITDDNRGIITNLKKTTAELTIHNFIFQGECRAGIFESGPYYLEDNLDPLVFKEFQYLYLGEKMFEIDVSEYLQFHNISKPSPVPNVIFGYTLDHNKMEKLEFNDWGTMFAEPSEFTKHITSIGIWTKELMHPKDYEYPDNLGNIVPLEPSILEELSNFANAGTKELYVNFSKMNYVEKLMLGVNLYTNFLALYTIYGGIENDFSWSWPYEYARDEKLTTDLLDKDKITAYIKKLEKFPRGAHPFLTRLFRRKKIQKKDPFYYYLQNE
ncbi:MAG: hypothetical protein GF329_11520 [Candidatus Lokiarchaeota archaeon]|nr:hypothetical protein [Candidatus Lokiarchaeota archaeon]